MFRSFAVASTVLALAACSAASSTSPMAPPTSMQDEQPGTASQPSAPVRVTLSGAVQKGPFVLGSSVTVTPTAAPAPTLSANTKSSAAIGASDSASADGQVFKTETSNDRGEFTVTLAYQGAASIEATGYYYNEAVGDLSSSPLTLRAMTNVGDTDASTYVNLVTHLTYQRVQALVAGGATVAEGQAQAETELQTELGFGTSTKAADQLNLEGGDNADDAYLFAVSTVFAQAAYIEAQNSTCRNCTDAKLQELVNTTAASFAADGTLSADLKTELVSARASIDNAKVEAALAARLQKTGSTATVPSLDRVIPWSVPKGVTDCAAAMDQSVSQTCRMALCGVDERPLEANQTAGLQLEQSLWSSCGADCWATVKCWIANCGTALGSGTCAPCANVPFDANLARYGDSLAAGASYHHECDADDGIAK